MDFIQQLLLLSLGTAFILIGVFVLFLPEVKEKGKRNHDKH